MDLNNGSLLGRYEPLVRLGRGGMASVWVARESVDGAQRLIALKAMLPELAYHSQFRSMFLEEGQIVRSIDHPNVVKVYEVGEDRGILYMAMDWVEGDSLRALIQEARRRRPIPAEIAVKIIADAASGLHAAHELRGWDGELRNVVHCDVSPHNILVGIDGRAKIVDFGVANARLHSDFGADEKVKGKFGYMSPEQAEGQSIDRRSDVFALGVVLFELTTGERLFRGESPAHTLHLVTAGEIPDPRSILPDYPDALAAITMRALARDPGARFQTADMLRQALERYLVERRIVVAHSSVAHLVRRVLGSRVDQLRQSVREALIERDGVLRRGLVSEQTVALGTFTGEMPVPPTRHTPYSGTPRPQSYEPPPPQRASWAPVLAAIGGVAAAAGSVFWVMSRPAEPTVLAPRAGVTSSTVAVAQPATPEAPSDAPDRVDVSSIPLGEPSAQSAQEPRAPRATRYVPTKPVLQKSESGSPEEPVVLEDAETTSSAEPADATGDGAAAPSSSTPEPEEIQLEETPASPPSPVAAPEPQPAQPPSGERGPFNRGAAMAQLGSMSSRTAACKSADGPSGNGRATITFSPDGRAARVLVGAPFSGTVVGQCVTTAFLSVRIPPFTGTPVTLPWSFRVPE